MKRLTPKQRSYVERLRRIERESHSPSEREKARAKADEIEGRRTAESDRVPPVENAHERWRLEGALEFEHWGNVYKAKGLDDQPWRDLAEEWRFYANPLAYWQRHGRKPPSIERRLQA